MSEDTECRFEASPGGSQGEGRRHRRSDGPAHRATRGTRDGATDRDGAIDAMHGLLTEMEERVEAVADLHRRSGFAGVDDVVMLHRFLADLGAEAEDAFGLRCDVHCPPIQVDGLLAEHVAVIVGELTANAAAHAWPAGRAGRLRLDGWREGTTLCLRVADNGRGLPEGVTPGRPSRSSSSGLGLVIVAEAVRRIDGTIVCRNEGGAAFLVTVPGAARAAGDGR